MYIYFHHPEKNKQTWETPVFQIGKGKGDIVIRVGAFLEGHSFRLKEGKLIVVVTSIPERDNPKKNKVTAVIQQVLLLMAIRNPAFTNSPVEGTVGEISLYIYGPGFGIHCIQTVVAWDCIHQHDVTLFLQGERLHRPTLSVSRCFCHAAIHKKTEGVSFSSRSVVNS